VLTTGLVSTQASWDFLNSIYINGGRQYFDILAKHSYGTPAQWDNPPAGQESCVGVSGTGHRSSAICLRNIMQAHGDAGRPLWATEFGWGACEWPTGEFAWPSPTGAELDATQRDFWRDAINIADSTRYYHKLIGYQLWANDCPGFQDSYVNVPYDLWTTGHTREDYGMGLVRANGTTLKPSYIYLRDRNYNGHVQGSATAAGNVTVYAPGKRPVGHSYSRNGNYVTFYVTVNKLHPTVVAWVAESGTPMTVSISGMTTIKTAGGRTWTCSASGGSGGYSYTWYRRDYGSSFVYAGGGTSYSTWVDNSDAPSFTLRCSVASAGQTASADRTVNVLIPF
jgi:hypothetical protein